MLKISCQQMNFRKLLLQSLHFLTCHKHAKKVAVWKIEQTDMSLVTIISLGLTDVVLFCVKLMCWCVRESIIFVLFLYC